MPENLVFISRDQMLTRIYGEYLEMPGLRLTFAQAQRLWGLDAATCTQLLDALVEARFLCRGRDGCYGRLVDGAEGFPRPRMAKAATPGPASAQLAPAAGDRSRR